MDPKQSTLMAYLQQVRDPRKARGKVFTWSFLLALVAAALASGCKTPASIVRWTKNHAQELLATLKPARRRIPSERTIRRVLERIPLADLEQQTGQNNQALDGRDPTSGTVQGPQGEVWQGQALDGKMIRGAAAHGERVHLVSLVRHGAGYTLGQVAVPEKSNEITAAPSLLAGRDLRGTVITSDAILTQRELAQQILDQGGHYLMVVKGNQPELWEHIEFLFRVPPVPALPGEYDQHTTVEKGHGRIETRTLEASTALNGYLDWPGVAQVIRRTYRCVVVKTGEVKTEVTYGITSLSRLEAGAPQLAALWRGHWTIENRDHYVRDETMGEDQGQVHTGNAPQALAALRNGILATLRHWGWSNIAAALDYYRDHLHAALQLIGALAT
jgi:predicted transposase YbfD/YdcC